MKDLKEVLTIVLIVLSLVLVIMSISVVYSYNKRKPIVDIIIENNSNLEVENTKLKLIIEAMKRDPCPGG